MYICIEDEIVWAADIVIKRPLMVMTSDAWCSGARMPFSFSE